MASLDDNRNEARLASSSGRAALVVRRAGETRSRYVAELAMSQFLQSAEPSRAMECRIFELDWAHGAVEAEWRALEIWSSEFPGSNPTPLRVSIGTHPRLLQVLVDRPNAIGKMDCSISFVDEQCSLAVSWVVDLSCVGEFARGLARFIGN